MGQSNSTTIWYELMPNPYINGQTLWFKQDATDPYLDIVDQQPANGKIIGAHTLSTKQVRQYIRLIITYLEWKQMEP